VTAKKITTPESVPEQPGRRGSIFSLKTWKRTPTRMTDPGQPEVIRRATTSVLSVRSVESASTLSNIPTENSKLSEARVVERKKVFWPRDLLPNDTPDANIYTYGYDADVIGMSSSESTSRMTFTKLGQNMLMELDRSLPDQVFCFVYLVPLPIGVWL